MNATRHERSQDLTKKKVQHFDAKGTSRGGGVWGGGTRVKKIGVYVDPNEKEGP